ncbi:MAG: ABC transporter ATP-binding protein [Pseudomonadota bacterium]|nr:ABC transporter ATP-binding protein [Pseudomonadota bacterium]
MTEEVLRLVNISKSFKRSQMSALEIFANVNLSLSRGEMVGIFSPSGTGKTTLLQIAGLLDEPSSGSLFVGNEDIKLLSDLQKTFLRNRKIGFVYQFHHLLPEFTALENVSLPQWCVGTNRNVAEKKARKLLDEVGLNDRVNHRPSELSGGEQQRVAVCRALVNDPDILLADEPTGNLDTETSEIVFDILIRQVKQRKLAALIVTHNESLAKRMNRVVQIRDKCLKVLKF